MIVQPNLEMSNETVWRECGSVASRKGEHGVVLTIHLQSVLIEEIGWHLLSLMIVRREISR